MALTFSLDLATPASTVAVSRALHEAAREAELFDTSVTPEQLLDKGAVTTTGTWTRVIEASPKPWHPIITDLGFTPTVAVVFRLDKENNIAGQQDDVVRFTSGILTRIAGDAVLHRELETIWLLRRNGEISISEQDDLWPSRRIAALSLPYRRATYAFAEE
jgi:hypothetical protein